MSATSTLLETTETTTTTTPGKDSLEWTLRVWRSADRVVTTDPNAARRQAYEDAVGEVLPKLMSDASANDLMASFWSERLTLIAGGASIRRDGRTLNTQVVAAAACWRRLAHLMA